MRYIDMSDKAKASVQRAAAKKIDWDAEMLRIEKEAEKVRDVSLGKQADRMVAQLRTEWLSMKHMKIFAETGINVQHVGLKE
jgi:hypothetical protein